MWRRTQSRWTTWLSFPVAGRASRRSAWTRAGTRARPSTRRPRGSPSSAGSASTAPGCCSHAALTAHCYRSAAATTMAGGSPSLTRATPWTSPSADRSPTTRSLRAASTPSPEASGSTWPPPGTGASSASSLTVSPGGSRRSPGLTRPRTSCPSSRWASRATAWARSSSVLTWSRCTSVPLRGMRSPGTPTRRATSRPS